MFLLVSSVAHDTVSVNEEMGKSLKNREMDHNVVLKEGRAVQMKVESQGLLLQIAREALACHFEGRILSKFQGSEPELSQKSGAFVTLHKGGQLRGCVGHIVSDKPLYETVAEAAIAAATRDPRFHRVNLSEMLELKIEISVLTPLQPLERIEDLEIGVHGLYIKHGEHSGLLLPQVAMTHNWNRTEFLQQTCKKAQLSKDAWQAPETEIYLFSSQVFGETL